MGLRCFSITVQYFENCFCVWKMSWVDVFDGQPPVTMSAPLMSKKWLFSCSMFPWYEKNAPISLTCSAIKSPSGIRGTYKVAIGGNQPTHTNLGCSTSVHAVHVQWLCYYCVTVWRIWLNYMNNDYHGHWPAGRAGPGPGLGLLTPMIISLKADNSKLESKPINLKLNWNSVSLPSHLPNYRLFQ